MKIDKIISVTLAVFLLTSVFPITVNADQVSSNKASTQNVQTKKVKKEKVGKITKELTEDRTENSKKYEKDDGSYEVAEYKTPIHYLDNGKWKDIDNTLQDSSDNGYLENKQNDFKVEIAKNASAQKLLDLKKGNYEVSWNLDKANTSQDNVAGQNNTEIDNVLNNDINKSADDEIKKDKELSAESSTDKQDAKNILVSNEKVKTLKNIASTVNFANVFSNTDLQYVLNGSDVKENIVINKASDNALYKFNLNAKNLTPVLQEDKSIIFYDSKDKSKQVFKIVSPVMYDKTGQTSNNIDIKLNQIKDGYELILTPDKTWLGSSDRVYPVTIDPSMTTSLDKTNIHDNFVCSNDPSNKSQNQYVRVGQTPVVGTTRTYIKFDLPQLSTGDMITSAQLNLELCSGVSKISNNQVNVHKINQDFNPDTISWGSQPSYDSNIEALSNISLNQDQWVNWDITSIAKQWFTQGNNYGLMLEEDNGGNYSAFWASNIYSTYASARPQVSFNFINNSGIENYWTYHSQDVGRAGTSYVNDYNGNLIFKHSDIDMNGSKMPVSINHVFNSNDKNLNIGYGNGWRLNISQKLEWQVISGTGYYRYTDEDGTRHYFENSSATTISDELNLGLTLTKETDGTYSITDKKNNKIDFYSGTCDLNYIKDANGNTMTFSYGTAASNGVRTLTKVTDGAGRVVNLTYNNVGGLTTIQDTVGRVTNYNYDGSGNLTSISYPDSKTSTYSYDGNHNLMSATNYDGYKISYQYYGISPYRVSDILESNTDGTLGDELSINYGNNSTTYTDEKGRKNVYEFDNTGKTLCIKDNDGSAEYYQYGDTTNASKLTSESKLEKTIVNLLTNHELETTDSWATSKDGGNGTGTFTTEASYLGNQSIKITKSDNVSRQYYDQWNNLAKGKTYTFSGYVKTSGVSNTNGNGAVLSFYYKDKSGVYQHIDSKYSNGTKDWQRQQVSFTLPNDASDTNVLTRLSMYQESGTSYFDSLQLEEGSIANRYNLIDNGDLSGTSGTPNKWSASGTSGSDGTTTINDSDHPTNLDNSVYQVNGVYGTDKRLGQSVNVHGKAGDIYSLGAWGKAYSVPSGTFQIQAAFITAGAPQWVTLDFNKASNDWQYASGECIAKSDYSRIDIYYLYKDNANVAYFDGTQLYKEQFGQSYQYDSKGNIVSTASLAQQNSSFLYNGNNDLIQSADPKGNLFKYEYDSKHNMTNAASAENINYGFNYDSSGNPISAKVGSGADYIQSKADYTASGNYIKSLTDSLGNTVNYNYDETKGLLSSVTDANGSTTNNGYDNMDRLTSTSKTVSGQQISNNYSYQNDKISQITHNGFNYNFAYDSLGNNTTVAVGNQNLITNTYEPRTSVLQKSTYGNGQSVSTDFDNLDRPTAKVVNGDSTVGVSYDAQVENVGWQPVTNDYNLAGTTGQGLRLEALKINLTTPIAGMRIKYQAHVQNIGWQDWGYDGSTAGTVGQGLKVEAMKIQLEGAPAGYSVRYQVHVEGFGWMDPVKDGEIAGTVGQNRRIEAIRISVEKPRYTYQYDAAGNIANENDLVNNVTNSYVYDNSDRLVKASDSNGNELGYNYDLNNNINSVTDKVNNTTHTTSYTFDKDNKLTSSAYGSSEVDNNYDSLGRMTNSTTKTGTTQYNTNYSYLPGAATSNTGVTYDAHVANIGWQPTWSSDGATAGTTGQDLMMEALKVQLTNPIAGMKIKYQAQVSNVGWQDWSYDGNITGTTGQNLQMEAVKIQLEGAPAGYHVYYQAHVANLGWMDVVQDGAIAGTVGKDLKLEALRIYIVKPGVDSKDSTKVASINNNGNQIAYTYDANENIKTITQNAQTITYTYNELNEVTREDNQTLNKTVVYTYDAGGNITNKVQYPYNTGTLAGAISTINYGYGDSNWKDKLTNYNGKAITYDAIGNPLNDGTFNYTWEEGRQLSGISGNGQTISYKYNDSGIRTQKTVNGVVTNYRLEGNKVTYEDNGTNKIYYSYDSAGSLLSMNLNGAEYYYVKNAQGDIIGLFDSTGTHGVSYTYDMWGKLISTSGSLSATVGVANPYRYKGYRYDSETGLYYLQSRYYNPDWGRFINADGIAANTGELLSGNMFAYCKNNPVSMSDADGDRPNFSDGSGRETQDDIDASLSTMSKVNAYRYAQKSSFSVSASAVKNTRAATMDKAASKGARQVVSVTKKWVEGGLATVKYVESPRLSEVIKIKGLGSVGSIVFTAKDIITSISNKHYAGACIDLVAGAAGIGAGTIIEAIGAGIIATIAAPELLVGIGVFAVGVGVGVLIDQQTDRIKDEYYGR